MSVDQPSTVVSELESDQPGERTARPHRAYTAAQAFVAQLAACGVESVFGNPGTTEYAILDAIQERDDIDLIVALHEGVAVSAAAGYARASGKVGVVELHASPGLGNGLGMIYNAWTGQTPLLIYVDQNDQASLYLEPSLASDLVAIAKPVTKWAYEIRTSDEVPQIVRRAMKVAQTPPLGPVVISLPMDISEQPCSTPVQAPSALRLAVPGDPAAIQDAVDLLASATSPVIVPGDGVVRSKAQAELSRLARLIGAPIRAGTMAETAIEPDEPLTANRLALGGAETNAALAEHDVVVAVGTKVFQQLFPIPGDPVPGAEVIHIGLDPWEMGKNNLSTLLHGDERTVLGQIAEQLERRADKDARRRWTARRQHVEAELAAAAAAALDHDRKTWEARPMTPARMAHEIVAGLPEDVCLVDEAITAQPALYRYYTPKIARWFRLRGGGIGEGLPMAVGVKLARPDSPVVALSGDGSSMYAMTALWTAAHHDLPVVWIILNNATYRILQQNAVRRRPGEQAKLPVLGTSLTGPALDFATIAKGHGVHGVRVEDPALLASAVRDAVASGVPTLLVVAIGIVS